MRIKTTAPDKGYVQSTYQPKAADSMPFVHSLLPQAHCPCDGGCPVCMPVQAKMKSGSVNNRFEKEADQMANQMLQGDHNDLLKDMLCTVALHSDSMLTPFLFTI